METDDAGELFTDGAERTAAALAADPGTAPDADACHVLGVYHWIRLTALPVGEAQDEALIEAVRFLAPVYDVDPEAVPEPLRIAFTGGQSED